MTDNQRIILYIPQFSHTGQKLQKMIEMVMPNDNIVTLHYMESLYHYLHQPLNRVTAAIILASTEQELLDLIQFRDLLSRVPTILILPNQAKDTVTRGHIFRPRFMTYLDSNFEDVRDVFRKIVGRANAGITFH